MKESIWHPHSEKPTNDDEPYSDYYLLVSDGKFVSTALYRPDENKIAAIVMVESSPCRSWHDWDLCRFTHWCYVIDLLNFFELC